MVMEEVSDHAKSDPLYVPRRFPTFSVAEKFFRITMIQVQNIRAPQNHHSTYEVVIIISSDPFLSPSQIPLLALQSI